MLHLLLIDDNPDDRFLIVHELQREFSDLVVEEVTDAPSFQQALSVNLVDLVITDYRLHWNNGLTVLQHIKAQMPSCPVIMFTDSGDQEIAVAAMKAGLDDYLVKSPKHLHRLSLSVRSVLHQKQQDAALQESEERLRLALATAQMGIWDWDFQTQETIWVRPSETWFETELETSNSKSTAFVERIHPEDRDRVIQAAHQALANHSSFYEEYRVILPDGHTRWMMGQGKLVYDDQGQAVRMLGTSFDITEYRQAKLALQKLNSTLEQQIEQRTIQLKQAIDFDATLKRITDKVRDSLDEAQIIQIAVQELAVAVDATSCNAAIYQMDEQIATIRYEYTTALSRQDQDVGLSDSTEGYRQLLQGIHFQWCPLESHPVQGRMAMLGCPILDSQGVMGDLWLTHPADQIFCDQDIGLVQQVANQCAIALRQARLYQTAQAKVQALEQLNRLKDDFLSTVSHELRTPIANMRMAIQMLSIAPDAARQERYLKILQTECEREADLVNNLLDLQRLESAAYPAMLNRAIRLQDWLPNVIAPFRVRAQARSLRLETLVPTDLPPLLVDPNSLKRIMAELLNNACKYTEVGGKIFLEVQSSSLPLSSSSAIVLTLQNQAKIPAAELPNIFKKFYRIPGADPWQQGGTGLGLALVKELVHHLNGTIQVESKEGWTIFTLQFPI